MSKSPIPAGYHDAEGAAKLLGISKLQLYKTLRELAWVNVGGDSHNLPRRELIAAGYMATQTGSYCLKGKKEIVKNYSALLLSQKGFQELKKRIDMRSAEENTPPPAPIFTKPQAARAPEAPEKPFDKEAADAERQRCLAELADMGIPTVSGWK